MSCVHHVYCRVCCVSLYYRINYVVGLKMCSTHKLGPLLTASVPRHSHTCTTRSYNTAHPNQISQIIACVNVSCICIRIRIPSHTTKPHHAGNANLYQNKKQTIVQLYEAMVAKGDCCSFVAVIGCARDCFLTHQCWSCHYDTLCFFYTIYYTTHHIDHAMCSVEDTNYELWGLKLLLFLGPKQTTW